MRMKMFPVRSLFRALERGVGEGTRRGRQAAFGQGRIAGSNRSDADRELAARLHVLAVVVASGVIASLPAFCGAAESSSGARAGQVILDMDSVRHRPGEVKKGQQTVPVGKAELLEGKFGKAVRFSFEGGLGPGFMTAAVAGTTEWDKADGFSFYVKGDGSTNWGGIELIDREDYGLRYGYCFPIDSTEWRKVTVRWDELTPELAGPLVDAAHGYAPSRFGNFWFGKWFYWRDYPAESYAIDQVMLEGRLTRPITSAARADRTASAGLRRVREKLERHRAITVVTMGDSLTDKRHWANRESVWSELVAARLKERYGADVKVVNPAIGGTTLSQNLVLTPRWLKDTPKPDLVTIWFGYNDWDTGLRGGRFAEYLRLGIRRLRQKTDADILIMTSCPAFERWETMRELEEAEKVVAKEQGVGLADVASAFRAAGSAEEALRREYWAWDKTHLGKAGHALAAETVGRVIEGVTR